MRFQERGWTMHSSPLTTPRLLLSVPETAEALGISERSLFSLSASGEIRCVRIGRRVLYSVEELQRFIQQHEKGGEA
jgi:excisionase family DNA binding protein